eukprot:m.152936 g.152936  ORF g.152936 m.152936 type:complete len:115 (+) comp14334_c0_seq3:1244-1588(+)
MDHGCSIVSTSHESLSAPHTDCTFAHSSTASRNNLTVEGLESLLRIALYQATHCAASDTEDPPTVLQGLVSVGYQQRGPIADADDVVKQLDDIFRARDPRYVPPPAEEAAAATE